MEATTAKKSAPTPASATLTDAFLGFVAREGQKTPTQRLKENALLVPMHLGEGFAREGLQLLTSGLGPVFKSFLQVRDFFKSPTAYKKSREQERKVLVSTFQAASSSPKAAFYQVVAGAKNQLLEKATQFFDAPKAEMAEQIGGLSANVAFMGVQGELGLPTSGSSMLKSLRKAVVGKPKPTAFKALAELKPGSKPFQLSFEKTNRIWRGNGGLGYAGHKRDGTTVRHMLRHAVPDYSRKKHSVFNLKGKELLNLIEEAWQKRGKPELRDKQAFVIDMKRVIGTQGESKIRLVMDAKDSTVIRTAYPWSEP